MLAMYPARPLAPLCILMLLGVATSSLAQPITLAPSSRIDVVTTFAAHLDEDYVIPELGKTMSHAVTANMRSGKYDGLSDPELALTLQRDVRSVSGDLHLAVGYSPAPPAPPGNPGFDLVAKQHGFVHEARMLAGNVGYVRIDGFMPPELSSNFIRSAFEVLQPTDALIIDLRWNDGGDTRGVAQLLSFLSDGPPFVVNTVHSRGDTHVESIQTSDFGAASYGGTKPVFVLTSAMTFSGGEECAYDIKALRRGTLVGARTRGGANVGGPVMLGQGFSAIIPIARSVNPITGTNWERTGVLPDVATGERDALRRAHILAIQAAKERAVSIAEENYFDAALLKAELQESFPQVPIRVAALAGEYHDPTGQRLFIALIKDALLLFGEGQPTAQLNRESANRYKVQGIPGTYAVFANRDGHLDLLIERPSESRLFSR
jgi:hypothetical protein